MTNLLQDIRYCLRMLRKAPGFTAIALLTLALGIGANTAIFSIVNAVLLQPLPYPESDRLVSLNSMIQTQKGELRPSAISYPDFFDWRTQAKSFTAMASYRGDEVTLTGGAQPLHLLGAIVAGDFFNIVGTQPLMGRGFTRDDEKPGSRVTVLSYDLWQSAFGGDKNIVGRVITLDHENFTVVGVMPAGYAFPLDSDPPKLWRTLALDSESRGPKSQPASAVRGAHFLSAVARLKPGVTLEQGREEMNVIARALATQYPDTNKRHNATETISELEHLVGDTRPALVVLLIAVGCVLLIACVNVANLLLVRASKRGREIAVRAALGAKRSRVIGQMLTESFVLALGGAALGIPLAAWATKLFVRLSAQDLPRAQSASVDATVLAFTAGVALMTSLFFGLAPALRASRPNLTEFMKEGRGSTASKPHQRLRSILVVAETALGLMLLVTAGLLLRSFQQLTHVNLGFDSSHVITFNSDLPEAKYPDAKQVQFYDELLPRLQALPGVTSAAAVMPLPLSGGNYVISFQIEGRPVPKADEPAADFRVASPGYFHTLGIPLLKGRDFSQHDTDSSQLVTIVNQEFARKFFPNEDPIGKRIIPGARRHGENPAREIVGVVGNVKHASISGAFTPEYYLPYTQQVNSMTISVKTAGTPEAIMPEIRRVVASMDPDMPLYGVRTMDDYVSLVLATPRFHAMLLGAFAGLALLLTAIGLYGVVAYTVAQRTHEIGVRMTLGATRTNVTQMVLGGGFKLTALGIAIGVAGALVAARSLTAFTSLLFGVKPTDTVTFAVVVGVLAVVSLLASYLPAYRASKVDPMVALRYE